MKTTYRTKYGFVFKTAELSSDPQWAYCPLQGLTSWHNSEQAAIESARQHEAQQKQAAKVPAVLKAGAL